ncbi:MAG: PP2C family protein-serine/threonine phosphatase [Acidimicrobiales bacterium]
MHHRVGELLPLLNAAFPAHIVDVLDRFLAEAVGATDVELLLADYGMVELRSLRSRGLAPFETGGLHPIDDSAAGQAYLVQAVVTVPEGEALHVYLPISVRDERVGVLGLLLPQPLGADTVTSLVAAADMLAYVVLAASRFTDMFEQARRARPLSLEAEVQWGLQPVRAFSCPEFSLAGQLVPAYDVGGDSYDWVVNQSMVSVYAIDAMGHGLNASMLGALAITALRNARRGGQGLTDRFRAADEAIERQFGPANRTAVNFVTAVALEIDIVDGTAVAVSAGHPWPYRLRAGRVETIELVPQYPLGVFPGTGYETQELDLAPGDRLVLLSDGVLEAAPKGGEHFGEARIEAALLATRSERPHEAVRHLVRALLDYQQGDLRDDATILLFDWHGRDGGRRRDP